jgi:hypothetical protein
VSDGNPTFAGLLGAKVSHAFTPSSPWRVFVTAQHGDDVTYADPQLDVCGFVPRGGSGRGGRRFIRLLNAPVDDERYTWLFAGLSGRIRSSHVPPFAGVRSPLRAPGRVQPPIAGSSCCLLVSA